MCFILLYNFSQNSPFSCSGKFKWVTLKLHTNAHVGLHAKCLMQQSKFNENWNVSIYVSKIPQNNIELKCSGHCSTCHMQRDIHKGEANRHTFIITLGEQTTTWLKFPQKVDNYTQRQETPCFYENVNFHTYGCSVWQMTHNFSAIYIKQSNEWVSASKLNKFCISLHNSAINFQQAYNHYNS